jgi:hypothetical protein
VVLRYRGRPNQSVGWRLAKDGFWIYPSVIEVGFVMTRKIRLALATLTLTLLILITISGSSAADIRNAPEIDIGNKAAIIDQLNPARANPDFIARVKTILENNGLSADYFSGETVTLELYRQLPARGYRLIIFRAHSGLLGNGSKADQKTCLFTNQPYHQLSELLDQLANRVVKAAVNNDPPLFGIGADFVSSSMRGRFNNTLILMMGCSSCDKDDLAQAFLTKGAAAYFGWNTEVNLKYDEDVTLRLLDRIFEGKSIETSALQAIQENGPDPDTGAELKYRATDPAYYFE